MSRGLCKNCSLPSGCQGASSERSFFTQLRLAFSELVGLRGPDAVPIYWENAHKDHERGMDRTAPDFFDDMYPVGPEHREVLQELLNTTAAAEEGDTALRLVRAVRVENSVLWGRYQAELARLRRKRGPCRFAGRGAPLTTEPLGEVPGCSGSSGFTQDLDDSVCEAYLWHGTKPQVAMQIAQSGFQVGHKSRAGKRFGQGGYFSEDPAKADAYAGSGSGLYEGCYAMLLCRVVLGKQYHVRSFRQEDATDQAGSKFDSTLAEPRGASWREFIAYRSEQVYPEYALVYERCKRDEVDMGGRSPVLCCEDDSDTEHDFPANWFHRDTATGCFHDTYPASSMRRVIQDLVQSTWSESFTGDRKSLDGESLALAHGAEEMPETLRVLKVLRVEDSEMWKEHAAAQEQIRQARDACTLPESLDVKTMEGLPERERHRLAENVNEVYLWHGSSPQRAMSIVESGFPANLRRFNRGMFGDGAYLVECAAHADEYSEDDQDGYYRGYYAMLLCRVTLGKPQVLPAGDPEAHQRVGPGRAFDSAVGERRASAGSFREFFVTSHAQIYPEYAIIYERLYDRPRSQHLRRGSSSSSSATG